MSAEDRLTDWQRSKLCEVILLGCERTTACHYVGATVDQLLGEMSRDEAYGREVIRAEAQVEVRHMANVHSAAKSEKNWRTSVWWLERRDQERSGGASDAPAEIQVRELVDALAQVIVAEIVDVVVQQRVIERLLQAINGDEVLAASPADETRLLTAPPVEADAHSTEDGNQSP